MKIFKVNRNIEVVCEYGKTRNGFKHTATLFYKGNEYESVKCNYLNRTWERYQYQSVLKKLAEKTMCLSKGQKKTLRDYIENEDRVKDSLKPLKTVATMASLGDIFGKTPKQKNDWKVRMLKAGLEGKGLIMPADWGELSEKEKKARLDGAIGALLK